jgi:low affinity Fe/Cu permease
MRRPTWDGLGKYLERFAYGTSIWVGSSWAFLLAMLLTAGWLISGPFYHFSDTWQLVMNTLSSVVTFLMVFLLQRSQNKEFLAIQVKLNELIASHRGASNRLIDAEDLSEQEVRDLHDHYKQLCECLQQAGRSRAPVSIEQTLNDKAAISAEKRSYHQTEKKPGPRQEGSAT